MTAGDPPELRLFRPTDAQRELVTGARAVFAAAVGGADDGPRGRSWRAIADSGLLGALVGEDADGLGLGADDLALLTEEAGHLLVRGPLVETAWMAVPALAAVGAPAADTLAAVLAGEVLASAVDDTLRGPDLGAAGLVVVPGEDGDRLVDGAALGPLEPAAAADPGARLERAPDLARAPGAPVPRTGVGALTLGRLGGAAYLLGVTRWLLETTVAHATARTQFGAPIGSFQAVRHGLADVHVELEFARSAVWAAAGELEAGAATGRTAVLAAAVQARRAFALADRHCLQVHGGLGFTWEHPLHRHLKAGQTVAARFGRGRDLAAALGDAVLAAARSAPRSAPPRPHI
ncbi:acyl-CoA dehydrogenase family protein [Modestobacter sp. NPDC049651]|uniref:acyl-CoA dehydrogenase family protein n=1 Tax=unclassified Modestobacter TaxID=2643866 RepID=UPI0033D8604F